MNIIPKKNHSERYVCALLLSLIFLASFGFSSPVQAISGTNGQYTVLAPLPCIQSSGSPGVTCPNGGDLSLQKTVDFKSYVQYIINLAIALSAVTAVLVMVYGGFEYITSTIPGVKADGRKRVTNAVLGLILVLCSYLLLKTIDPRLVQIPNTLVPKLTLNNALTQNATAPLLDQLQNEANNYHTDISANLNNIHQAQASADLAKSQLNDTNERIKQALGSSGPDDTYITDDQIAAQCASNTDIQALCAQRQGYVNQINQQQGIVDWNTATAQMDTLAHECFSVDTVNTTNSTAVQANCDLSKGNNVIAQSQTLTAQYYNKLVAEGQTEQAQKLIQYANCNIATLYMNQAAAVNSQWTGDAQKAQEAAATITKIYDYYSPHITDPATLQKLQAAQASANALVQQYAKPK